MLRQQLAATSSQLDGVKKERDDARQQAEQLRHLEAEIKVGPAWVSSGGDGVWAWCASGLGPVVWGTTIANGTCA